MNAQTVSWNNAPEYAYRGYRYMPHLDESKNQNGEIIYTHVWHDIYHYYDVENAKSKGGYAQPAMTANAPLNRFMTEEEFKNFVDYMGRVTE